LTDIRFGAGTYWSPRDAGKRYCLLEKAPCVEEASGGPEVWFLGLNKRTEVGAKRQS
tara:strand:+ start:15661 stop:15831 length:171 start_codon:yes stop_codon:yes gene_type:complete